MDTSLQTEEKEDKKDGEAKTSKATRILYLTSEQAASRTYPYGEFPGLGAGLLQRGRQGAYGLEKYYDETLAGTPGRSVAETDAYGDLLLASGQADVHEAIDGSNLNLTIDENVQSIVEEYLDRGDEHLYGPWPRKRHCHERQDRRDPGDGVP